VALAISLKRLLPKNIFLRTLQKLLKIASIVTLVDRLVYSVIEPYRTRSERRYATPIPTSPASIKALAKLSLGPVVGNGWLVRGVDAAGERVGATVLLGDGDGLGVLEGAAEDVDGEAVLEGDIEG
jgi:hypothetical protein